MRLSGVVALAPARLMLGIGQIRMEIERATLLTKSSDVIADRRLFLCAEVLAVLVFLLKHRVVIANREGFFLHDTAWEIPICCEI